MRSPLVHLAGLVVVATLAVWLAGWTGPDAPSTVGPMLWVLVTSAPLALLWIAGAGGVGHLAAHLLLPGSRLALELRLGLGVAIMLWLDATLGRVGLLDSGGGIAAWILSLGGASLLLVPPRIRPTVVHPIVWIAAPAAAVLIVGACSAPGWLWRSEFGGYDALSYHLQLPREWMAAGRIAGPTHNVYGFLPGFVESAYLHLAVMRRDPIAVAPAAQLLHASLALATAAATGRLARQIGVSRLMATLAGGLVLATPWVVVVGSLAYDEMAVTLLLATGLALALDERLGSWRCGLVVGLVVGAACGAKLTAIGLVAMPLGVVLLAARPPTRWPVIAAAGIAGGGVVLAPWLIGNAAQTGNPVFPFATTLFGHGHWTAAQAATWTHGHVADVGVVGRLAAIWNELLREGIGPSPHRSGAEPWLAQWALLPWLGLLGLAACWLAAMHRRAAVWLAVIGLIQVGFWAAATHLQSRFLLPIVVPAATLAALGLDGLSTVGRTKAAGRLAAGIAAAVVLAQASVTVVIFRGERDGAPAAFVDAVDLRTGDGLSSPARVEMATIWPEVYVNLVLPEDARVLLVGEAAPFYYALERIAYHTTWDRGPMSAAIASAPDDPSAWPAAIRERGFTHVLVRPEMLERWQAAGWADPGLTAQRVLAALRDHATLVQRFPAGIELFELPPR